MIAKIISQSSSSPVIIAQAAAQAFDNSQAAVCIFANELLRWGTATQEVLHNSKTRTVRRLSDASMNNLVIAQKEFKQLASLELAKLIGRQYYIAQRPGDALKIIPSIIEIIKRKPLPTDLRVVQTKSITRINEIISTHMNNQQAPK
jgi:hypothetical protein